jgi:hypothetical protein
LYDASSVVRWLAGVWVSAVGVLVVVLASPVGVAVGLVAVLDGVVLDVGPGFEACWLAFWF